MQKILAGFGRWLLHKVSIALLANAVAIAIPLYAVGVHVTDSETLKSWLNESNTYQNVITQSINLIQIDSESASSEGSLGDSLEANPFVDASIILGALGATLEPEFIRLESEMAIDGVYVWLDGDAEVPPFTFSLTEKQAELNQNLKEAFIAEFADLPLCRPDQLGLQFNLLESFCAPPGVDVAAEVDKLVGELAGEKGLLAEAEFSGSDLIQTPGEDGGLDEQQVQYARTAFESLKLAPLYFLLAGILSVPFILFTSKNTYKGYYEIGYTMFSGSLFVFITAVILTRFEGIVASFIGEKGDTATTIDAARTIFEPFLEVAVSDIALLTAQLSGAVLFAGSILVMSGAYMRRQHRAEEEAEAMKKLQMAQTMRSVKAIKKKAKKHPKPYRDKTLDPNTKKPLKASRQKITVHHARKIARHPDYKKKKISKLLDEE